MDNLKLAAPIDLLKRMHKTNVQAIYPHIEIALRLFLTVPVTTASRERSFSKLLKHITSAIGQ